MADDTILKVQGLGHRFGDFRVLSDINMEVKKGGISALIGPNGAGKTTFYNLVTGMFRPTEGKIFFKDQDITGLAPHKIVNLGLVRSFQITNIFPELTVHENILIPLIMQNRATFSLLKGLKKQASLYHRAEEILSVLGLDKFAHKKASELAYGDKRLIEVGIVLAREPEMILLDEPTAGMNPEETEKMIQMIHRLSSTLQTTFFITEHDMKVVFSVSSYIYVLHQGRLLTQGTPSEIRANTAVKEAYLGGSVDT